MKYNNLSVYSSLKESDEEEIAFKYSIRVRQFMRKSFAKFVFRRFIKFTHGCV